MNDQARLTNCSLIRRVPEGETPTFLLKWSRKNYLFIIFPIVSPHCCSNMHDRKTKRLMDTLNGNLTHCGIDLGRRMTKPTKWHVSPAKTQIRPVWSKSSLCAQWVAKDPRFLHADSEYSDQTRRMLRLIRVFAGRTCHFVCVVMRWLIFEWTGAGQNLQSTPASNEESDRLTSLPWGALWIASDPKFRS